MDTRPANVDYSDPRWNWPCWKFHLSLEDLFGSLYDEFNTIYIPIQEPVAFHHDVFELCSTATTLGEFRKLLKQRRDQRVEELRQCWDAVSIGIAAWPPALEGSEASVDERWAAFLHFSREFSFDTLNRYFSLFTHNGPSTSPALPPASLRTPSHRSHGISPSSGDARSEDPIPSRKRKASSAATSVSDEDDEEKCGARVSKKLRIVNEPCRRGRARQGPSDVATAATADTGATAGFGRGTVSAPTSAHSEEENCNSVRRSSRIAARTQRLGHRHTPGSRTKEAAQATDRGRYGQSASGGKRRRRKGRS